MKNVPTTHGDYLVSINYLPLKYCPKNIYEELDILITGRIYKIFLELLNIESISSFSGKCQFSVCPFFSSHFVFFVLLLQDVSE